MERVLIMILMISLGGNLAADSFRCGRKIVKTGESSNALIKKCGQPVRKLKSNEQVKLDGQKKRTAVSNWVYERRNKKDMIVSVKNGTVVRLEID
jgi:hypothetical protein